MGRRRWFFDLCNDNFDIAVNQVNLFNEKIKLKKINNKQI